MLGLGAFCWLLLSACADDEARGNPIEEAWVIPMEANDGARLAALLAGFAHENGLYFRDSSHYMDRATDGTINIDMTLFRQLSDGGEWHEITASRSFDGYPSLRFQDPPEAIALPSAHRLRADLIARVKEEWPQSTRMPVLPHGGIPHTRDLIQTAEGMKIKADAAELYGLPSDSSLVEHNK